MMCTVTKIELQQFALHAHSRFIFSVDSVFSNMEWIYEGVWQPGWDVL